MAQNDISMPFIVDIWSVADTKLLIVEYAAAKKTFAGTGRKRTDMFRVSGLIIINVIHTLHSWRNKYAYKNSKV